MQNKNKNKKHRTQMNSQKSQLHAKPFRSSWDVHFSAGKDFFHLLKGKISPLSGKFFILQKYANCWAKVWNKWSKKLQKGFTLREKIGTKCKNFRKIFQEKIDESPEGENHTKKQKKLFVPIHSLLQFKMTPNNHKYTNYPSPPTNKTSFLIILITFPCVHVCQMCSLVCVCGFLCRWTFGGRTDKSAVPKRSVLQCTEALTIFKSFGSRRCFNVNAKQDTPGCDVGVFGLNGGYPEAIGFSFLGCQPVFRTQSSPNPVRDQVAQATDTGGGPGHCLQGSQRGAALPAGVGCHLPVHHTFHPWKWTPQTLKPPHPNAPHRARPSQPSQAKRTPFWVSRKTCLIFFRRHVQTTQTTKKNRGSTVVTDIGVLHEVSRHCTMGKKQGGGAGKRGTPIRGKIQKTENPLYFWGPLLNLLALWWQYQQYFTKSRFKMNDWRDFAVFFFSVHRPSLSLSVPY